MVKAAVKVAPKAQSGPAARPAKAGAAAPARAGAKTSTTAATLRPAEVAIPTPAKASPRPNKATTPMSSIAPTPSKADPKLADAWKAKSPKELTDAEVLAMPEGEYMKPAQLEFFRHRLSSLRQELLRSAGETTEHLREDTLLVPDPADRATIEEEHALELRARDRERKLLKKVEQALALIDSGEYGWCEETGEPIGIGRLLARPTATLSLEAQQRRELKQKMFGD